MKTRVRTPVACSGTLFKRGAWGAWGAWDPGVYKQARLVKTGPKPWWATMALSEPPTKAGVVEGMCEVWKNEHARHGYHGVGPRK